MRRGRGNIEIPAIVSEHVCVRDGGRKNGYLTDKEETQTDMGNNEWREAVHFLLQHQGRKNMHFKKIIFCSIIAVMEYMRVHLHIICWPTVN